MILAKYGKDSIYSADFAPLAAMMGVSETTIKRMFGLDFSNVTNANDMFSDAIIRRLDLSGCNFESINDSGANIFGETEVKCLILDNCKFRNVDDWNVCSDYRGLMEVSLKGWGKEDCRDFTIAMERGRSGFIDIQPTARYLLDPIYEYRISKDSDENIICEILIK